MHFDWAKWKPEYVARMIVDLPLERVRKLKFEHKRTWRRTKRTLRYEGEWAEVHSKPQYKPVDKAMQLLAKARDNAYWKAYGETANEEFPRIGIAEGPLMADGRFTSYRDKIPHPLPGEREREPFQGMYSRAEHDEDVDRLEYLREMARENFILGQRGEGPKVDGLVYMRVDAMLLAEIEYCDARLRFTRFILSQHDKAKPAKQTEQWSKLPTGTTDEFAITLKQRGFKLRKIETTSARWWEMAQ